MDKSVTLTDEELVLLDGRCRPETQVVVDAARSRLVARDCWPELPPALAGLIGDAIREARSAGLLTWTRKALVHCGLCGRSGGYATVRSGPRRGKPNYDRPLSFAGVELARRFITVRGYATLGGCQECVDQVRPALRDALVDLPTQLPDELYAGGRRWTRWDNVRCSKCQWEGHEGQMGRLRTLMGDGTYPAICPSCGAQNRLGRTEIERTGGFTLVEKETAGG